MLVVAYFAFLKKVLHSLCPMVLLTGFPCPGCGLTRAGFRVLRLDFVGAWRVHPFIFAVIFLIVVFAAERYVCKSRTMNVSKWCAIAVIVAVFPLAKSFGEGPGRGLILSALPFFRAAYDSPSARGKKVESCGKRMMARSASSEAKISGRADLLIASMLSPLMFAPT